MLLLWNRLAGRTDASVLWRCADCRRNSLSARRRCKNHPRRSGRSETQYSGTNNIREVPQTPHPIYLQAARAATAPSAAAVVSWRTSFVRQSPAAKIPGADVMQSSAASINPLPSSLTTSAKISFFGICPTAMNTPATSSLKSFPVFLLGQNQPFHHIVTQDVFHYGAQNKFNIFFGGKPFLLYCPPRGIRLSDVPDKLYCSN